MTTLLQLLREDGVGRICYEKAVRLLRFAQEEVGGDGLTEVLLKGHEELIRDSILNDIQFHRGQGFEDIHREPLTENSLSRLRNMAERR